MSKFKHCFIVNLLNLRFRKKNKATDVLSFPQDADEDPITPGEIILGDIDLVVLNDQSLKWRGKR